MVRWPQRSGYSSNRVAVKMVSIIFCGKKRSFGLKQEEAAHYWLFRCKTLKSDIAFVSFFILKKTFLCRMYYVLP